MDRSTLQRIVIVGGGTAGNHLKEEESKFFQVAGRLLSATKKERAAYPLPTRRGASQCAAIGEYRPDFAA